MLFRLNLLRCRYLGLAVGLLAAYLAGDAGHQVPHSGLAVRHGHVRHATARTISVLYGTTATFTKTGDFRLVVPARRGRAVLRRRPGLSAARGA